MARMTLVTSLRIARNFIAHVNTPNRQRAWSVATVESFMPAEYRLHGGVDIGDFFPLTIKNVALVIRTGCEFRETETTP